MYIHFWLLIFSIWVSLTSMCTLTFVFFQHLSGIIVLCVSSRDEEVEKLYQGLQEASEKTVSLEAQIMAHSMILTGEMPENFDKVSTSQVTAGGGYRMFRFISFHLPQHVIPV